MVDITELPISSNPGQQNADKIGSTINEDVKRSMGKLQDTGPEGRLFLKNTNLFGYDGVIVNGGKIVSLINVDRDEDVATINLGAEVTIEGDSRGYVSSGHKPGDKVKVIAFIEPFYQSKSGLMSSDKIIEVEGEGVTGWIKPLEMDRQKLKEEHEKEIKKLFENNGEKS